MKTLEIDSQLLVIFPCFKEDVVKSVIIDRMRTGPKKDNRIWISRLVRNTVEGPNGESQHGPWNFDDSLRISAYRITYGWKRGQSMMLVNWAHIEPLQIPWIADWIIRTVYGAFFYGTYNGSRKVRWTVEDMQKKIEGMEPWTPAWWLWMNQGEREEAILRVLKGLVEVHRVEFDGSHITRSEDNPYVS